MTEKLKWGVLGTANIGKALVNPAIQASVNGELDAIASRDLGQAQDFAASWGIPRAFGSYQELLDDEKIEAVYIPLPNSLHCEWTIRAAQSGKHILCEKPLALNQDECLRMEAAAEENGVKLMEAFMYRFHPRTQKVLELVQAGAVGAPRVIRSSFSFRLLSPDNIRLSQPLGGGALMDVGCYCVNISRTLAGREPVQVQAMARIGQTNVDEELVATLCFSDGLFAQFDCALTLERREEYEIAGPEGALVVPNAFLPGTGATVIEQHRGRSQLLEHEVAGVDQYQLMVEHFADCVLNDRPLRYSATEAGLNMRVIQALHESVRKNGALVTVRPAEPQ